MAKIKGVIVVDTQRCKGCGICVTACPLNLIEMSKEVNAKGYTYAMLADADQKCIGCASCGIICPDSCIKVYREKSV